MRAINVPGGASQFPRKKIDTLVEFVKTYGAKGLAWMKLGEDGTSSSFAKFMTEDENNAILERVGAQTGDLVLIVADGSDKTVFAALGALRCECAKRLELTQKTTLSCCGSQNFRCLNIPKRKAAMWPCIIRLPPYG